MNKKIRRYLPIFVTIVVVIIATIVLMGKKVDKEINTEKNLFVEAIEVSKNDKAFYDISVKKNVESLHAHKSKRVNNFILQMQRLLSMQTADISKLDQTMQALLMDKKIPRIDKINAIWGMLQEIGFLSEQSKYLLDSLSTLLPIELTKDIINVYSDVKDPSIKMRLIDILAQSTSILNPEVQDEERLNFIVEKIQDIQLFLKEDVLKEHDTQILESGLYAYADIADAEDMQELITSLKSAENGTALPAEVLNSVLTEAAMSTPQAQEDMLPELLKNVKNRSTTDPKQQKQFNQMMLDGINAGVINPNSQQEIGAYLETQEPPLDVKKVATTETMSEYYTWAKGMSKLKEGMALDNIVQESSNPLKVSSIILYADEHIMQQIKENPNTQSVYAKLEATLEDDSINEQTKSMIKHAMDRLKAK